MPTPSGRVYLCANAIVDRNYNHTIDFKNPGEQSAYWGSLIKYSPDNERYSYIRRTREYITVPYTMNELQDVNYLFYKAQEDGKMYYCFVTHKEYLNDEATYVYFEVDVMQTRMFEYQVKPSYVLQEHCDRWNADHKPIYSITEEGLDYGSEYTVESAYKVDCDTDFVDDLSWYIAVCAPHQNLVESGHNAKEPTVITNLANPYILFSTTGYSASDSEEVADVLEFMNIMADSELGTYVKQILKIPYLPFDLKYSHPVISAKDSKHKFATTTIKGKKFIRIRTILTSYFKQTLAEMGIFEGIESAMPTAEQWEEIKANPYTTERDKRFESKLLTHPYRYNILSDWKNSPVILKNEYLSGEKIKLNFIQSISFNGGARYWVDGYRKDIEGRHNSLSQLISEENPIVSDQYYEYMLANRNQIQADKTNAIISSMANMSKSAFGGALFGGGLGAISGALTSGLDSAIGIQNMIRSQNAKQQDLKNLPDTIINSNDSSFNRFDENDYVTFYRMKICCEFEELLADTFNMTGYTVKRVKMPNLKTRARFNYVKTVGANIIGSFDQNDLSKIKAIFDNGITFWHYNANPDHFKPFDYSIENIETKLL